MAIMSSLFSTINQTTQGGKITERIKERTTTVAHEPSAHPKIMKRGWGERYFQSRDLCLETCTSEKAHYGR
jgi:hypothetical protein